MSTSNLTKRDERLELEALTVPVRTGSKALGIGLTKTWELIKSGELATVRIGRRRLVVVSSLRKLAQVRTS